MARDRRWSALKERKYKLLPEGGFLSWQLGSGFRLLGRGHGLEPAVSLYFDKDFKEPRM